MSQSYGHLVLVLVDCIAFSYHAYALILLYKTNIKFANQLRAIANFAEKEPNTCQIVNKVGTNKSNVNSQT